MGSKGSQKTTQSYTPNASVGQTGTQALDMARHAAGQPFQIPAAPVANFTDDQLSAFADMRNNRNLAQPYMQQAGNYFNQSAQPISASQIGNYLNPFASYVMGGLQDIFGQQRTDATGRLTQAAGGAGADRIAVAQANLAKQQGLAAGQTLAGIYQPALAAAQADAQRQQSAAYGMGQLGTAAQNAALQGSQAVLGAGNQQQALEQQRLMSPYQQRLAELEYPFKTAQFLSGINAQQAQPLGGTQTNTYPGQSPWGTIAGLGLTAAGAFTGNPAMMGAGIKGTMGSQSGGMTSGGWNNTGGGWNPNVSGGYVYPGGGGGTGMAPWSGLGFGRGGVVNPYDFGRTFGAGGYVDLEDIGGSYQSGGDVSGIDWNNPQPPETPPDVAEALATGAPLPDSAALPPPPPPTIPQGEPALPPAMRADLPPEITGNEGMPPTAMGYAPMGPQHSGAPSSAVAPPWLRNAASFPPRPPTAQPVQPDPYALPPDQGEGTFARSPGLALMNAGLATLAASGRRDSRGLPMSPWAAIGEGGMKGVETLKGQEEAAQQRRRVDLEARRLLIQADKARRESELHPLELKAAELKNRQAEIALSVLVAGEESIKDPRALKELGISPAQAAILGPAGIRAVVQDLIKSKYDIKEVNGETWAIDRVDPRRSIRIGEGRGLSAYGIPEEGAQTSAAPSGVLGTQPPRQPVGGVAPASTPPSAAGSAQPAGRRTTPPVAGIATEAFGPGSVLNWLNLKVQGTATNTATTNVTEQARAVARINILRDRLISALASGQPGERLKMVQERVQGLFPKPGQFFTPAPEAKASFVEFHAELGDRIRENEVIIKSPGYSKQTKDKAAQAILEQRRVRDQLTNILENMSASEQPPQRITRPKNFEKNRVYDTPKGRLRYLGDDQWGPP